MKSISLFLATVLVFKLSLAQRSIQYYTPVKFSDVQITDHFWKPKIDLVATKSLQACIYQTEVATPRIQNLSMRTSHRKFKGIYYDDSDGIKRGNGLLIKNHPDTAIENTADRWIGYIAAAQCRMVTSVHIISSAIYPNAGRIGET
jgi:hypothetical protein